MHALPLCVCLYYLYIVLYVCNTGGGNLFRKVDRSSLKVSLIKLCLRLDLHLLLKALACLVARAADCIRIRRRI